jgi:hypothetical protein
MPKGIKGWAIWLAAQAGITTALAVAYKFVLKLIENAVTGWGDEQIAAWFGITSPSLSVVFSWSFPFILAATSLFAFYRFIIWHHQYVDAAEGSSKVSLPVKRANVPPKKQMTEPEQKPKSKALSVQPNAPRDWERLFAVGDDDTIWLKFLPDTKNYKADTLILILYGYSVLMNFEKVNVRHAHAQVQKTIDGAPNKPGNAMNWLFGPLAALQDNYEYADNLLTWALERIDLSQGGRYRLTNSGQDKARTLSSDLISRA